MTSVWEDSSKRNSVLLFPALGFMFSLFLVETSNTTPSHPSIAGSLTFLLLDIIRFGSSDSHSNG
jgi:hypothetical protein